MVKMPKCMAWLDDEPIGDLDTMEVKVDNPSPQYTPQVLLSIELYIPPVTYPKDLEETIGIPMEVEPLDYIKLEDLGLNTNTHDLFLSSKGFPSVNELEPQLLPNFHHWIEDPKKNDLKPRSILMMTLPSEHLLTFNQYNDAKTLFEAIEARFGDNTAKLSDATIYAFLANQPNGSQVVHEDLEQIHEDDLEEIDLKWQLAFLSLKPKKFYQRTGKKIIINRSDTAGYDNRNQDSSRRTVNVEESSSKAMLAIDGVGFDWSFMIEEEIPTNFSLIAFSDSEKTSGAPIIKDWVSDCDEDETLEKVSESVNVQKPKQADQPRKTSQNPRNNITNWNTPMSKKLGVGFQFTLKACFMCGSFNHLIKDCDFPDKKMIQKHVLNNVKKGIGQRKVRPVWNNAMRTNHQNFSNSRSKYSSNSITPPSLALVPISTAKQSSSRAATSISIVMPIKTVAPKPFVNVVKSRPNAFQKSHSPSRRSFYQHTALKNKNLNNRVNIVKVNYVNTAKGKSVISVIGEQGINVVKSKACWVWRPKIKVLDHVSKNNGSYIYKQFDYVDPTVESVSNACVPREINSLMSINAKMFWIVISLVFELPIMQCWLYTTQQMVINLPCLTDKKELTIPGQTTTDAPNRFEATSKRPMIHLSQEFDQERKEADDIDWSKIIEHAQ
ncbi:hypothetical protein Tco_0596770 [Tanacetum coccineum]